MKKGCWGCNDKIKEGKYIITGVGTYKQINPCDYHLKLFWGDRELDVKVILDMRKLVRFLLRGLR